jgi:Shikimate kinase
LTKNLVLTGMMGVGKTSVGRSLAKKLNFSFIDIDKIIEDEEGSSIDAIFKNKSERYFRSLENKITLRELNNNKKVISLFPSPPPKKK